MEDSRKEIAKILFQIVVIVGGAYLLILSLMKFGEPALAVLTFFIWVASTVMITAVIGMFLFIAMLILSKGKDDWPPRKVALPSIGIASITWLLAMWLIISSSIHDFESMGAPVVLTTIGIIAINPLLGVLVWLRARSQKQHLVQ